MQNDLEEGMEPRGQCLLFQAGESQPRMLRQWYNGLLVLISDGNKGVKNGCFDI